MLFDTAYLVGECRLPFMQFNPSVKAPPGYGTREFYRWLDANAPAERSGNLAGEPRTRFGLITIYPIGYYSALAVWMKLTSLFSNRLTVLFFSARIFSVVLLALSLVLSYALCRELRLTQARALLLTAIAGTFPMTTFVSSYVQADNLALTLVLLCCYVALRFRRRPDDARLLTLLGITLGLLCITKYHTYVVVLLAVLPMLIADQLAGRRKNIGWPRLLFLLLTPTVIVILIQVWITYGSNTHVILSNPSTEHTEFLNAVAGGKWAVLSFLIDGAGAAFSNFYLNVSPTAGATSFASFWGLFGWEDTPLIIASPAKTEIIDDVIALFNLVVFALTLFRLQQVATRLITTARRGRWRLALRVAFCNPLLNAYFLFIVMMCGLFMVVRKSFAPQGRNWFAFILPIFMVGAQYASKALYHRVARRAFASLILTFLLIYCLVGSYYAIRAINDRYYGPPFQSALDSDTRLGDSRAGGQFADPPIPPSAFGPAQGCARSTVSGVN